MYLEYINISLQLTGGGVFEKPGVFIERYRKLFNYQHFILNIFCNFSFFNIIVFY